MGSPSPHPWPTFCGQGPGSQPCWTPAVPREVSQTPWEARAPQGPGLLPEWVEGLSDKDLGFEVTWERTLLMKMRWKRKRYLIKHLLRAWWTISSQSSHLLLTL